MNFDYHGYQGFDISTYQDSPQIPGHVDFQQMKDWGAHFVIIKAGQRNYIDPDFPTNWAGAKGTLPRASYWYYDNREPPKSQATLFWSIVSPDPEGILWLDLEDRQSGGYAGWQQWYNFLATLQLLSGYPDDRIGIYTAFYYFQEFTTTATNAALQYFKRFPLWLASYPRDPFQPNYESILVPPPWTSPLILQSGTPSVGNAAGVESEEIDYNQFNGDAERFEQVFGSIPDSGDGDMTTVFTGTAKSTSTPNVRVRKPFPDGSLDVAGQTIAGIIPNHTFKGDGFANDADGKEWVHVIECEGNTVNGWSAGWLLNYTKPEPIPPPTTGLPDMPYTIVLGDDVDWEQITLTGIIKSKK